VRDKSTDLLVAPLKGREHRSKILVVSGLRDLKAVVPFCRVHFCETAFFETLFTTQSPRPGALVRSFTVVIEHCPETKLYVGYVPGFPGAHSQGESLDELRENMLEVITMLLEDGEPTLETEFVGIQTVQVA
jgi:predicted RNase H-like HicB family nuclease